MRAYKAGDKVRITNIWGQTNVDEVGEIINVIEVRERNVWSIVGTNMAGESVLLSESEVESLVSDLENGIRELIENLKIARDVPTTDFSLDNGFALAANFAIRELERLIDNG